jgi:hypothetical protein
MAISRMQQPRQMYGLGSLVKSVTKGVKSAVSGVKDLVKSDVGKALGIAALGFGIPGTSFGGLFGRSSFMVPGGKAVPGLFGFEGIGPALEAAQTKLGLDVAEGEKPTLGQFGKVFALGSLGGAALEALTASGASEEELGNIRDVDTLRSYLRRGYEQLNPKASPMQVDRFVEGNTAEYKAEGGRIGYQDGTPKEGIETITPMKKPDNDVQYVRDTIKSLDGFAQLIAQEGNLDRQTFQNHMDMFEDFRQRKDIDAMPAYTYLQRRVQELNPEVAKMIYITQEDNPNKINIEKPKMAMGGRMGFAGGTEFEEYLKGREKFNKQQNIEQLYKEFLENKRRQQVAEQKTMAANGGRIGYALGDRAENNAMQASGIMDLPLNQNPAGVTELDLRDSGGFIPPVGVKEKADDIPAMLSNNEFVFTADAVRGMGDGDVNKGAQRMYDMMKKLENGGRV